MKASVCPEFVQVLDFVKSAALGYKEAKADDGKVELDEVLEVAQKNVGLAVQAVEGADKIPAELKAHPLVCAELAVDMAIDVICDVVGAKDGQSDLKEITEVMGAVEALTAGVIKALPGGVDTFEVIQLALGNVGKVVAAFKDMGQIPAEAKEDLRDFLKTVALGAFKFFKVAVPA
jgi:hypothetical protein